jgi:hypothetical protein
MESIDVAAIAVNALPENYILYDEDAVYEITINSNPTGKWKITKGKKVNSTYVTDFGGSDASRTYSNELNVDEIGLDYTHTVVWFAVLWKVQAMPDTVVVDYGLPVDISVLTNDMFGERGKLVGVGPYVDGMNLDAIDPDLPAEYTTTYTGKYGTATVDTETGKVRYTLTSMEMNGYDKFVYAVQYTGGVAKPDDYAEPGYYYDTVTVIHYKNTEKKYIKTTGEVLKIDPQTHSLTIELQEIFFENIYKIKI